jgi:hypothetical protein
MKIGRQKIQAKNTKTYKNLADKNQIYKVKAK